MRKTFLAALSAMMSMGAASASATMYYVAPPTMGSNSNAGTTRASPWATIGYAEEHSAPTESYIEVQKGEYRENVNITHGGILFPAEPYAKNVTILGSVNIATSRVFLANLRIKAATPGACITVQHGLVEDMVWSNVISECAGPGIEEGSKILTLNNTIEAVNLGTTWKPTKSLTWYWQLQGTLPSMTKGPAGEATAWDVDGFEASKATVEALHAAGHKAVCYIDVGTWESWRPDAGSFPSPVLGKDNGWPGEKYLDTRALSILEPIMTKRFEMCRERGFDGVEPDNVDTYEEGSKTGFPLTASEQLTYNEWVATEVHSLGMAVFQKNDGNQTSTLKSYFDGAITEECNLYSECGSFSPYITEGKPVLNAEYGSTKSFCAADEALGIQGARLDLELDGKVFEPCW